MKTIIHLSNTPLVGAPGKVSYLCNENGYDSLSIAFSDYPEKRKLNNKFLSHSILWDKNDTGMCSILRSKIQHADIIHIHNVIHPDHLNNFNFSLNSQKFIYPLCI